MLLLLSPSPPSFVVRQMFHLPIQSSIFPKLGLTQIWAPQNMPSGRDILYFLLSQATDRQDRLSRQDRQSRQVRQDRQERQQDRQELSALIDASDCFDAGAAEAAGVDLSRLLWVRCGKKRKAGPAERGKMPEFGSTAGRQTERHGPKGRQMKPLEQAFKAADILIQNGGLGLIVIDLGDIDERLVRKIPLTTWFRFARVIEKQPTALVVFATYPAAQSCADLTLHIKNPEIRWNTEANSEGCTHSNQQIHSRLCSADLQGSDDQQQGTGVQQQTEDDQQQAAEETCEAGQKGIAHTQFLSGLTYEVEIGRARGQGRKPAQPSDIDLWLLKHSK